MRGVYENGRTKDIYDFEGKKEKVIDDFIGILSPDNTKAIDDNLTDLNGNIIQAFSINNNERNISKFSKDGKTVLSYSNRGAVRLWETSMLLEDFLKAGNIEPLNSDQKARFQVGEK